MPTITVPIIVQSIATPPVFYGMIGTLELVLDTSNNFVSGTVAFTKPQLLANNPSNPYTISQVGTTPVIQNGNLQFQAAAAASSYPGEGQGKSKPPFTFTGQIDVSQQQITGQLAWLPLGAMTTLGAQSTSASGNFTLSSSGTFSDTSVFSLSQWQNPLYSTALLATGLQGGSGCDFQIGGVPTKVPTDMTFYLNLEGGTSGTTLDLFVWQGSNTPSLLAALPNPSSNAFNLYSWAIPPNLLAAGTNYLRISNLGQSTDSGTTVYIKTAAIVW
jgi:hypothetical protein